LPVFSSERPDSLSVVLRRRRDWGAPGFSKLKCFRRFATRYEKSKACFRALVALACAWLHLRLYVDTA